MRITPLFAKLMMAASSRLTGSGETNIVVPGVRGCNQGTSTVE
jgi:hypothetical protein